MILTDQDCDPGCKRFYRVICVCDTNYPLIVCLLRVSLCEPDSMKVCAAWTADYLVTSSLIALIRVYIIMILYHEICSWLHVFICLSEYLSCVQFHAYHSKYNELTG